MNIVICDDEKIQRIQLSGIVSAYFNNCGIPYQITEYENGEQLLFHHDQVNDIDILLLDIKMDGISGIEVAQKLRDQGSTTAIIFVTGDPEFIYEGFHVNAVNYLLKPIHEEKVIACLEKAIGILKDTHTIIIQSDNGIFKLLINDVIHIQSEGHYLQIYTTAKSYRVKKRLKDMEQELDSTSFMKIGKSDIIHLDAVMRITSKSITMKNGIQIPVPKGKYREISEAFMQYHFHHEDTL